MIKKINIFPAVQDVDSTVTVRVQRFLAGAISEDVNYTFDANDFDMERSVSNKYLCRLIFGSVITIEVDGSTTQFEYNSVAVSPNDAYTLAGLVEDNITPFATDGGGAYTFPVNHGNVAYVSSGGNNGTAVVANISKPFSTANAAIAALNPALDGTIIILSSTVTIAITDYDYSAMPYNLTVSVLCNQSITFGGSCSFGILNVNSKSDIIVNTQLFFIADTSMFIDCRGFTVPNTAQGVINYIGIINCSALSIAANNNIDITADVLNWTKSALVGVTLNFTYNKCPPKIWKAKISQSGVDAPTIDIVNENTFGPAMTTSYIGVGEYTINNGSSLFTVGKTNVFFGGVDFAYNGSPLIASKENTLGAATIYTFDSGLAASDNMMNKQTIIIETYL